MVVASRAPRSVEGPKESTLLLQDRCGSGMVMCCYYLLLMQSQKPYAGTPKRADLQKATDDLA